MCGTHLVAVYGTLRRGETRNKVLNAEPRSRSRQPGYSLHCQGAFPAALPTTSDEANQSIVIEIYDVTDETLERLDIIEGYVPNRPNNLYNRRTIDTVEGQAYIYEYNHEPGPSIPSGDWLKHAKEKHGNHSQQICPAYEIGRLFL